MKIREILTQYWGYYNFRPLQEEVIQSVLDGNDTLALFPTGGGKSLCFQVPALAMEGITIVISPLIALMRDQVAALKSKGIKAEAIYSGLHSEEIHIIYSNAIHGGTKLLYISPERLKTETFRDNLPYLNVNLIAVDEAHCISQWGYDFRPPYRQISEIREFIPKVPVMALTATATPEVVEDIQLQLKFKAGKVFRKTFARDNLTYVVLKEQDKLKRVQSVIKNIGGSGIVYARSRKKTVEYAQMLSKYATTDFYHAGLGLKERNAKQKLWMENKTQVVVSTNAFGMGIDKPDVRFVIHMDIPDAVESYFQEAGRGGRDGKQSYAVLIYDDNDLITARENVQRSFPEIEFIKRVYDALGNYFQIAIGSMEDRGFDFDIREFTKRYNMKTIEVYHALAFLEKDGYIYLNEAFKATSKIHIITNKENLYAFQLENPAYDALIKVILRSYPGLFSQYTFIDEKLIGNRLGISPERVMKGLQKLDAMHLINYVAASQEPQVIYTQPRLESKDLYISKENYHDRKERTELRLEAMLKYVQSTAKCRSLQLLEYFGETEGRRCGKCDICLRRNKVELSKSAFDDIIQKIRPVLQSGSLSAEDLMAFLQPKEQQQMPKVLRFLLDSDKIYKDGEKYCWAKKD